MRLTLRSQPPDQCPVLQGDHSPIVVECSLFTVETVQFSTVADTEWTRFPIARLRYSKATRSWSLYWRDRNLRFHLYDRVPATASIVDLLEEVDRDPTAIFWG